MALPFHCPDGRGGRAARLPRKRAERPVLRPPAIMALPFHWPDWRVNGASPARLAIRLPSRVPSSGSSAMSVRAVIGPTPGTEARRSTLIALSVKWPEQKLSRADLPLYHLHARLHLAEAY